MKKLLSKFATSLGLTSLLTAQGCQSMPVENANADTFNRNDLSEQMLRWRTKNQDSCIDLSHSDAPKTKAQKRLSKTREVLANSSIFEATAKALAPQQILMCDKSILGDTGAVAALYRVEERAVFIDLTQPVPLQVQDAAHETRHAWQAMIDPTIGNPADNFRHMKRLFTIEADAEAFAKAVTWDLKQNGISAPWYVGTIEAEYQHVAKAFEQTATTATGSPAEITRKSMDSAFHAWIDKEALRGSYYQTNWNLDSGCILSSGPAVNLAIGQVPGRSAQTYIDAKDSDKVHRMIASDAQRLVVAARQSPNLSPARKQQWQQSFSCRA